MSRYSELAVLPNYVHTHTHTHAEKEYVPVLSSSHYSHTECRGQWLGSVKAKDGINRVCMLSLCMSFLPQSKESGVSKLPVGVNVTRKCCLSVFVSHVIDWWAVQDVVPSFSQWQLWLTPAL